MQNLEISQDDMRKRLLFVNNQEEELQNLFPAPSDPVTIEGCKIKPNIGLCVKTKDVNNGKKVFLNVCTSSEIPVPEDLSEDELLKIFESDDPSDFKVPMSIGPPHQEKDKGGSDCTAYDTIINTKFFDKIVDSSIFQNFFVMVTLEGLDAKYGLSTDKKGWTVLKNKKYLGVLSEQNIHTTNPLVQELSSIRHWEAEDFSSKESLLNPENEIFLKEVSSKKFEKSPKVEPQFKIFKLDSEEKLIMVIDLPEIVDDKLIDFRIGEDRIVLETPKHFMDIFVPYKMEEGKAEGFFVTSSRVLKIHILLRE